LAAKLPLKSNLNVYIDPAATVRACYTQWANQVTSDTPVTFQAVNLRSTTGAVSATFVGATFVGPVSATTTTGAVTFVSSNCRLLGNQSLTLTTTTGSVNALVSQSQSLEGNLTLSAATTTGSDNLTALQSTMQPT
jgi:hypothetical protein